MLDLEALELEMLELEQLELELLKLELLELELLELEPMNILIKYYFQSFCHYIYIFFMKVGEYESDTREILRNHFWNINSFSYKCSIGFLVY